jgi:hypothetical protein
VIFRVPVLVRRYSRTLDNPNHGAGFHLWADYPLTLTMLFITIVRCSLNHDKVSHGKSGCDFGRLIEKSGGTETNRQSPSRAGSEVAMFELARNEQR